MQCPKCNSKVYEEAGKTKFFCGECGWSGHPKQPFIPEPLKAAQKVKVFRDPKGKRDFEGFAYLVERVKRPHRGVPGVELWAVQFVGCSPVYERWINQTDVVKD